MSWFNKKEPLGLPKGSIRAILALGLIGSSIYALFRGKLNVDEFIMVTSVIIAFYFTSRNSNGSQ